MTQALVLIAASATIVAFLAAVSAAWLRSRVSRSYDRAATESASRGDGSKQLDAIVSHLEHRLSEARRTLRGEIRSYKLWRFSSQLLLVGQYVVGVALASSFLQATLSSKQVGVTGVVVLVASAIRQQLKPETRAKTLRKRIALLRYIIRRTEDRSINGLDGNAAIQLTADVTMALKEVEESDEEDGRLADDTPVVKGIGAPTRETPPTPKN